MGLNELNSLTKSVKKFINKEMGRHTYAPVNNSHMRVQNINYNIRGGVYP